jgi:proteasome lid subunit RPN8/RPN11
LTLSVSAAVRAQVEKAACAAYPEEACGLLVGPVPADFARMDRLLRVTEARPLPNGWEAAARGRRYELDPRALMKAEASLAGEGLGIVGIYHSHPDVPAWPSPFDLERAWPCYSYWIVCVRAGLAAGSRSWIRSEDGRHFVEEPIVEEESHERDHQAAGGPEAVRGEPR